MVSKAKFSGIIKTKYKPVLAASSELFVTLSGVVSVCSVRLVKCNARYRIKLSFYNTRLYNENNVCQLTSEIEN